MSKELKFHPLADIFPLMEGAEFDELVADIKVNGLAEAIVAVNGMILDGRNRYRACRKLGIKPWLNEWYGQIAEEEIGDPAAYVISRNLHRRHLTAEQKRELIAKVIAAKPEASDRQIAKQVKADHKTVGAIRKAKEATGEVAPVEKRTGADGKARKQPAQKGWSRERYKAHRARKHEETPRWKHAAEFAECGEAEAKQLAAEVVARDRDLARRLRDFLDQGHDAYQLQDALGDELGPPAAPAENAPPLDVGAQNMKAQFAAADAGADPGWDAWGNETGKFGDAA